MMSDFYYDQVEEIVEVASHIQLHSIQYDERRLYKLARKARRIKRRAIRRHKAVPAMQLPFSVFRPAIRYDGWIHGSFFMEPGELEHFENEVKRAFDETAGLTNIELRFGVIGLSSAEGGTRWDLDICVS